MSCVFGPIPSRRLGRSLGIDPIPLKTCHWNCVYCQLGRTRPVTNERREYIPVDDILREAKVALSQHAGAIDWVTISGSGEPTLHSNIGELIDGLHRLTEIPIALMTSGALFYLEEVRAAAGKADAVLPTLDAGNGQLYRRINRPHPDVSFARQVEGLVAFGREYRGKLWIEVMLMHGINDGDAELEEIAAILDRIGPSEIHINLPVRSPAETWVRPAEFAAIDRAIAIFERIAVVRLAASSATADAGEPADIGAAILDIIIRHPMTEEQLARSFPDSKGVPAALAGLETKHLAQRVERLGTIFWSAANAFYP